MKKLIACGLLSVAFGCTPPHYDETHRYRHHDDKHHHDEHEHEHEERQGGNPRPKPGEEDKRTDAEKEEDERIDREVDDLVIGGLDIINILKFASWWRISP